MPSRGPSRDRKEDLPGRAALERAGGIDEVELPVAVGEEGDPLGVPVAGLAPLGRLGEQLVHHLSLGDDLLDRQERVGAEKLGLGAVVHGIERGDEGRHLEGAKDLQRGGRRRRLELAHEPLLLLADGLEEGLHRGRVRGRRGGLGGFGGGRRRRLCCRRGLRLGGARGLRRRGGADLDVALLGLLGDELRRFALGVCGGGEGLVLRAPRGANSPEADGHSRSIDLDLPELARATFDEFKATLGCHVLREPPGLGFEEGRRALPRCLTGSDAAVRLTFPALVE